MMSDTNAPTTDEHLLAPPPPSQPQQGPTQEALLQAESLQLRELYYTDKKIVAYAHKYIQPNGQPIPFYGIPWWMLKAELPILKTFMNHLHENILQAQLHGHALIEEAQLWLLHERWVKKAARAEQERKQAVTTATGKVLPPVCSLSL
jgi:hypothetical protein